MASQVMRITLKAYDHELVDASAKKIIDKNGDDPENYTMRELEIIMTCENMVLGLIDAINLPVVNEDGIIEHEAVELLNKTEENVRKLESKLR